MEKIKGRRQNDQRTAPKRSKDAAKKIKGRRKKDQRMPPKRSNDAAKLSKKVIAQKFCPATLRPCYTEAMP